MRESGFFQIHRKPEPQVPRRRRIFARRGGTPLGLGPGYAAQRKAARCRRCCFPFPFRSCTTHHHQDSQYHTWCHHEPATAATATQPAHTNGNPRPQAACPFNPFASESPKYPAGALVRVSWVPMTGNLREYRVKNKTGNPRAPWAWFRFRT